MEDSTMTVPTIKYPYLPEGRKLLYVPGDDSWMQEAQKEAEEHSLDDAVPTGAVIVKNNVIIGRGANGSDYHKQHGCERKRLGSKTGEDYDTCDGCHPKNHAERRAVFDAMQQGYDARGADLYLWGHWWACKPCWDAMIEAGIRNVFLLEDSEQLFNKPRAPRTDTQDRHSS